MVGGRSVPATSSIITCARGKRDSLRGGFMHIAFAASEGVPFSKTGGLADVVGALPKALAALGHEVEVILPRYQKTPQGATVPQAQSLTLPLGSGFKFAAAQDAGRAHNVQTYLIDCPEYFDREG